MTTPHNNHYYIIYITIITICYSSPSLSSLSPSPNNAYIRREPVQRHLPKTVRVCRAAPSCCACAPRARPWSCWTQWPAWTEGPQQCGPRERQTAWWRRAKMSAASWRSLEVHLKKESEKQEKSAKRTWMNIKRAQKYFTNEMRTDVGVELGDLLLDNVRELLDLDGAIIKKRLFPDN